MKKIFLDTNFIIDFLLRDDYKKSSQMFLAEGVRRGYAFHISYLSVANFAYIARKLSREQLYSHLRVLTDIFSIADCTSSQISRAISLDASDFEDNLQYQAAKDAKCECIITRNEKDFEFSDIPVMSATEYSRLYF